MQAAIVRKRESLLTACSFAHTASLRVTGLLRRLKADILQPWGGRHLEETPKGNELTEIAAVQGGP